MLRISLNLSKWQYINLRDSVSEQGASIYRIIKESKKLNCYPSKEDITVSEDEASIKLQALLDLAVSRSLEAMQFDCTSRAELQLICKWFR